MKKLLLGLCLIIFAVSCSKKSSDDSSNPNSTTDVYLKVKIEGEEFKFVGPRMPNEKGCAIISDNNGGSRMVAFDGTQYINFWLTKVPLNTITTTSYTYARTPNYIDWQLNGYEIKAGSVVLTINKITNGKHTGTFSGNINMTHNGTTKVTAVTGEFNNIEIVQ